MARFNQIKRPEESSDLGALYADIVATGWVGVEPGVPSNFVTSFSERPDILAAAWTFTKGTILSGVLPPTVKEMIAMAIAMQNNCGYCVVAHTNALESMGVPKRVIESCAGDPELAEVTPPQRVILKVALKAAADPKSVTDEDFQALREDCGLSDGEILEVMMTVACASFLDFWADVSGITVDGQEDAAGSSSPTPANPAATS